MDTETPPADLPLFPLRSVLFPGGLLSLKIFEARYLDLMSLCMRERRPFGVVALNTGTEARASDDAVTLEPVGVLAELLDVDSEQAGILLVRCKGTRRFTLHSHRQQPNGLWMGRATELPDDDTVAPVDGMRDSVQALRQAITSLQEQDASPFLEPFEFDSAGWVANRWCEILPISQVAKQKLMELSDPGIRLKLVDDFLRKKGVVK